MNKDDKFLKHHCGQKLEKLYHSKYDRKEQRSTISSCVETWRWCPKCQHPVKIDIVNPKMEVVK